MVALIVAAPAFAQQPVTATTDSGQAVLLYPDGTWKYKEKSSPPVANQKSYSKPSTATEKVALNQGKIIINFDPEKWKQDMRPQEPGSCSFTFSAGDGFAKVIGERIQMPLATLKHAALENARQAARDARVVSEEKRLINGREVLYLQMKGTVEGIPLVYLGYYYSGKEGSVQVITFTAENLFEEFRKEFEGFMNGLEIVKAGTVKE
jgi:hypothetical protein